MQKYGNVDNKIQYACGGFCGKLKEEKQSDHGGGTIRQNFMHR